MSHAANPNQPRCLDWDYAAPGQEPHYGTPTAERKFLKQEHQKHPKVLIGSAWKLTELSTPQAGITPVFTARCLSQLGGRPNQLELDPRLFVAAPAKVKIPWGFMGWCVLITVIGSILTHTM